MRLAAPHYVYADPIREPLSLDALIASGGDREGTPFDVADPMVNVEETAELTEAGKHIEKFLNTLSARDRAIVRGVFWDGRSQADIARSFRVSGAAVSKRLSRITARGKVALAPLRESALLQ